MALVLRVAVTVLAALHCVCATSTNALILRPNLLETKQVIYPHQPVYFELQTEPDQPYEVKLSYRATTPSLFKLRIVDAVDAHERIHRKNMRRVLNTEKTFVRGVAGKVFFVEVSMEVEGISYRLTQDEMNMRRTEFDILLEEVVLEVLPRSAVSLIAVAIGLLAFMLVCVYPRVVRLLTSSVHGSTPSKLN
ncbi:Aste57867_20159 [Aphanomyces stellatus]|uniref:Aste57867_20159 protein n=1 Tax=Aphanomyces stellatus TaxID=120398 RepID=A0A485LJ09_9STRA|nr:hypothetical protein As57867_020093 [Aphanomyces stellatus]VFT96854.1 Aste57867_20159 [Aphanomyces stellatus]